jgi:acetyl-CoA C-acetyltransferase
MRAAAGTFGTRHERIGRDLGLDSAEVDPNDSGISVGRPIAATRALFTVKALHGLHRTDG